MPDLETLRQARDRARNRFVLVVMLLFVLGGGTRIAGAAYGFSWPANVLIVLLLLGCLVSGLAWAWRGWQVRREHDPWAYDPELDGPVAQEFEGRTFGPGKRPPQP